MTRIRALSSEALRSCQPTIAESRRHAISVGGTDLRDHVAQFTLSLADDGRRPVAKVRLKSIDIPPVDYFAALDVSLVRGDVRSPSFGGAIMTVESDGDELMIDASAMAEFQELAVAPHATIGVDAMEMIYMLARTSGFDDDRVQIHVGSPPLLETIEVAVPVLGCAVNEAVNLTDRVRLIPRDAVDLRRYSDADPVGALLRKFDECKAVAITYVTDERRLFGAEEQGRTRIRTAIDWLTVQLRNGSSHGPDGKIRSFDRAEARTALSLQPTVLVTGLLTGRSWLRDTSVPMAKQLIAGPRLKAAVKVSPLSDARSELSYAAMGRAGDESLDLMIRVTALWDALEFYAAGVEADKTFTKSEMRALRKRSVVGLSESQIQRLDQGFQQLNAGSLMQRIWIQATRDDVPVSSSDREVIARMRAVRNDAIHGRDLRPPSRDELAHAVSVVARLLVHAAYSRPRHLHGHLGPYGRPTRWD